MFTVRVTGREMVMVRASAIDRFWVRVTISIRSCVRVLVRVRVHAFSVATQSCRSLCSLAIPQDTSFRTWDACKHPR